jgi:hypothetical protein
LKPIFRGLVLRLETSRAAEHAVPDLTYFHASAGMERH